MLALSALNILFSVAPSQILLLHVLLVLSLYIWPKTAVITMPHVMLPWNFLCKISTLVTFKFSLTQVCRTQAGAAGVFAITQYKQPVTRFKGPVCSHLKLLQQSLFLSVFPSDTSEHSVWPVPLRLCFWCQAFSRLHLSIFPSSSWKSVPKAEAPHSDI